MDGIERRTMLLTLAGGTLLSLASGEESVAQTTIPGKGPTSVNIAGKTLKLENLSDFKVTAPTEVKNYENLFARLVTADATLDSFKPSLEDAVVDALKAIGSEEKNTSFHNPRLIEPLLGEIASLVDRCIAYRREASELELAGIAGAAARLTFDTLSDIDRRVTAIDISGSAAASFVESSKNVEAALKTASDKNLGEGLAIEAAAQISSNSSIAANSETRSKLLLTRLTQTQDIQRQLLARQSISGAAENYLERFQRVRALYEADIKAAYRRALAAQKGLAALFDRVDAVPAVSGNGFLDTLLIWTRDAMRAVTHIGESEIEFTKNFVVPIPPGAGNGPFPLDTRTAFAGLKSVRLRSISMSYTYSDGSYPNNGDGNGAVSVVLLKTDETIGPKPVVVNPNVRCWSLQGQAQAIDGALLYNVDPRGNWSGRVNQKGMTGSGDEWANRPNAKNLVVQFHVVAVPDPLNDGSFWTSADKV